jgi:hypothetical protein
VGRSIECGAIKNGIKRTQSLELEEQTKGDDRAVAITEEDTKIRLPKSTKQSFFFCVCGDFSTKQIRDGFPKSSCKRE